MDVNVPPPTTSSSVNDTEQGPNHHIVIDEPPPLPLSPATILTSTIPSNMISSGSPSRPSQIGVRPLESERKGKEGYWKMKEAESIKTEQPQRQLPIQPHRTPSSSSTSFRLPENDDSNTPQLSHTANTITTAATTDVPMTPNTSTSSLPPPPPLLERNSSSNTTSTPITSNARMTSTTPTTASASQPKKRGRKKISPPPLMTTKGISLVFRMPPGSSANANPTPDGSNDPNDPTQNASTSTNNVASGSGTGSGHIVKNEDSRASTPDRSANTSLGSVDTGSKKKRKPETSLPSSRPTRGRPSPIGTPLSGSPAPSGNTNIAALSIFAPPPPTDQLPEALQSSIPPGESSTGGVSTPMIVDADAIRKEAAAGFESRLRSRTNLTTTSGQRRDGGERTGISASGKDVRVGGTARTAEKASNANSTSTPATNSAASKKKGKGKADVEVPNQDFCSACRGIGRFLCCDGCPRSFHFMCLEPPLRIDELPDEETWYCKKCRAERLKESGENASPTKEKEMKPVPMVFKQLSKKVDEENPCQFRLPQVIRTYFAGVGTAARGEYVDAEEARTKYDRKGFQEDRDPIRMRDGKNKPINCYSCGGSSLPNHSLTTDPESTWRQIVSCDYCSLSWHLDCLDPPLSSMPNSGRKWMCPNHAEQALPRKRTVRNDIETIDIESRHQPNNGNIIIIPEPDPPKGPKLDYEDLVINRKKYRVPEKIIRLDFWEKVSKNGIRKSNDFGSNGSEINPSQEDMEAANLVLSLLQPSSTQSNNEQQPAPHPTSIQMNGNTEDSPSSRTRRKTNAIDHNERLIDISPLPTPRSTSPSTPNPNPAHTNGFGKPSSTGKTKIVLRMPAGSQAHTPK